MKVIGTIFNFICCITNVFGLYIQIREKPDMSSERRSKRDNDDREVTININIGNEQTHHRRRHHHSQEHHPIRCQRNRITATGRLSHCRRMHIYKRIN